VSQKPLGGGAEDISVRLAVPKDILHRILEASSSGQKLTQEERDQLALLLRTDDFFVRRDYPLDDEKAADHQIRLLGRNLRKALISASKGARLVEREQKELKEWLYSAGRQQRRFKRRQISTYVVYTLSVLGISFIVLLFFKAQIADRFILLPLLGAIGILIGSAIKDAFLDKNIDMALSEIKSVAERSRDDVRSVLEKNLRPRIISLNSREEVLQAANEMLLETIQESKEHRFVYFIGAASLSTPRASGSSSDDRISLVEQYNNRLRNLEGGKVPVTRYIAMIKPADFPSRREETQKEYVTWLGKQLTLLKGNPKYELIDCPRAQPWGGSRSSIITYKAFLDIVGEGDSGFVVKDEEVARALRKSSERLFGGAVQHAYGGDDEDSLNRLNSILTELKK
jgi:hypothetical protein